MNEVLFTVGSLLYHVCWVGLVICAFGKPAGWVTGLIIPYFGMPAVVAYALKFWRTSGIGHRIFGAGFILSILLLLIGGFPVISSQTNDESISADQSRDVETVSDISPEQAAMMAEMQEEMDKQTLSANLQHLSAIPDGLSGEWVRIADNRLLELVNVTTEGTKIRAVRLSDDSRVPKGETVWKMDMASGRIEMQVAGESYRDPQWIQVAAMSVSTNRISLLPLYDDDELRPFEGENYLEIQYIPNPLASPGTGDE